MFACACDDATDALFYAFCCLFFVVWAQWFTGQSIGSACPRRAHVLSFTSIYCMRMACLRLSVVFVILVDFVDCVIVACDLVGWHIIFKFTFKNAYDVVNGFFFEVGVFQQICSRHV